MTTHLLPALLATLTVAFIVNLPLGFWRAGLRKYSWQWFLAIHLSIPLVIAVRISLGVPLWYVPLVIAVAISGQLLGSLARRRCRERISLPPETGKEKPEVAAEIQ